MNWKRPYIVLIALHAVVILFAAALLVRQKVAPVPGSDKIVVLPIEGTILHQSGGLSKGMSVRAIVETLREIEKDDDVKAVVLAINSPGGAVGATQEIYQAVKRVREGGKAVVSSFGDVAASGGYYIACAGNEIVSNAGSLTGSIGVIMQLPIINDLLKRFGVTVETIKAGRFKAAGSPFTPLSEVERAHFNDVLQSAYRQFYAAVQTGRSLSDDEMKNVADGRVFTGSMAVDLKLVDHLGGLQDAIERAKALAGISDRTPRIIHKKEKPSIAKLLQIFSRADVDPAAFFKNDSVRLMYLLQ